MCEQAKNMSIYSYTVFAIIIVSIISTEVNSQLQCRDEDNQPVDWYVLYKVPKLSETSNPLIKKGVSYLYITSKTLNNGWKLSEKSIGAINSIPGNTLAPLYTKNDSILWSLYNDQGPNKTVVPNYGHTKGVVMADVQQGFWLVHSVPHYPPVPDHGTDPPARARSTRSVKWNSLSDKEYNYPKSATVYGQSFLCVSVNKDQFNTIGTQLMYNQIIVYKNNLPEKIAEQYPVLTKAANKIRIRNAPYYHKTSFRSLGGKEFLSFAKSDKWDKDLYDDFVAPQLGSDLLTETWPNGPGRLPSDCSGSKVINIKSINLLEANVVFTTTRDHSKWAVSSITGVKGNWVCIGDINRASSQLDRGGGTVCLNSKDVWTSYRQIVNDVEPCPKTWSRLYNWITNLF